MQDPLLNALRYILFWDKRNSDRFTNEEALVYGYINHKDRLTLRGFKYIAEKIKPSCVIPNCEKNQKIKCFCHAHYQKYYRGARGEQLIDVQEKPSNRLMILLEQVCRQSKPLDISLLLKNKGFMNLVEEGIEKDLLKYEDENLIQITPEAFAILD